MPRSGRRRNHATCAKVHAKGTETGIRASMGHTDTAAEIQNTFRVGTAVVLDEIEVLST
jgi:hypothetical protein